MQEMECENRYGQDNLLPNNDGGKDDEDGDDLHPGVDIGSQTSAPEKEAQSGSHQSRRKRQTKG